MALRGAGSGIATGLTWALADAEIELGKFDMAAVELRQLLEVSEDFKGANRAAVHNALGTALLVNGDAAGALSELDAADSILCSNPTPSPPCLAIALNRADAELAVGKPDRARERLDSVRAAAVAAAGRGAARWHLLDSRWRLQTGDAVGAGQAMTDSRSAFSDASDPIIRANGLRQQAAIAEVSGDAAKALALLLQAEQSYRSRWTAEPPSLREVRASIVRLRAAVASHSG